MRASGGERKKEKRKKKKEKKKESSATRGLGQKFVWDGCQYGTGTRTYSYHVDRENVSCEGGYIGSVIGFELARVKNVGIEEMKEGVVTGGKMVELDVKWAGAGWLTGYFPSQEHDTICTPPSLEL